MKLVALSPSFPRALLLAAALLLVGCSDSGTEPKDELAPLVGTWRAQALVLTNQANPSEQLDLVEAGAVFTVAILSTGSYTATLTAFGQSNQEIGTIEVSGNQITMTPINPPGPTTQGTWSLSGGILSVDGTTEFDFNLDGTREAADIHIEFYSLDS